MQTSYREFFKAFGYSDKDTIYTRLIHDKEKANQAMKMECELRSVDSFVKSMERYNKDGYGVFFVVNGGGHDDKSVKVARAQFIDMDDFSFEEQWKRVNEFPLTPSIIIKTKKSLHCYWLLVNGKLDLFEEVQKRLICQFGSDPTIKNRSRVMRLHGFYHQKSEPVLVELVKFEPTSTYTQEQLLAVLPKVKSESRQESRTDTSSTFTQGNRTSELVRLLGVLQNRGFDDDMIISNIRAVNAESCKPPLTDAELEREVFPALRRWEKGKTVCDNGAARPFKRKDFSLSKAIDVEMKEPEWLIPGYIPKYGITTVAGEGGVGKTSFWCSIVAAITTGNASFMENGGNPFAQPGTVVVFSAEDSWNYVLKKRLMDNGADMERILFMGPEDERFTDLNFDSDLLKGIIETHKPDLVIFDPVQAFVPANLRMGDRNAMRKCFSPLIGFGETYKTTFIVIAHANKQSGVWGRKRIADSSDIWDASRSVLMTGIVPCGNGLRYVAHEKSNWGKLQDSVIFDLQAGVPVLKSYSQKKDREFVLEESKIKNDAPAMESAKEFIMDVLSEHKQMEVAELDELAKAEGISKNALKDAKSALRKEGATHTWNMGYGESKKYFISLKATGETNE